MFYKIKRRYNMYSESSKRLTDRSKNSSSSEPKSIRGNLKGSRVGELDILARQYAAEIARKQLRPNDVSLSGKSLAEAGYRQENGFHPKKAVVAPEDFIAGRVKYVSSHGGGTEICFVCDEIGRPTHARFITLRDPRGEDHVFDKGEAGSDIADFTDRWIQVHGRARYQGASSLSGEVVDRLRSGDSHNGWTCTDLTYTPL